MDYEKLYKELVDEISIRKNMIIDLNEKKENLYYKGIISFASDLEGFIKRNETYNIKKD